MRFYQRARERADQTAGVVERLFPELQVGEVSAAALRTRAEALDALAQALEVQRAAARTESRVLRANFKEIRKLTLAVPGAIAAQGLAGEPDGLSLRPVWTVVPQTPRLAVRRAQALEPVWRAANERLAARPAPEGPLVVQGADVTKLQALVEAQAGLELALKTAEQAVAEARRALVSAAVALDGWNKRFYQALRGLTEGEEAELVRREVLRGEPTKPRCLRVAALEPTGPEGLELRVHYAPVPRGSAARERWLEWTVESGLDARWERTPALPEGNVLGPFAPGTRVQVRTRSRNGAGSRTSVIRAVTLGPGPG